MSDSYSNKALKSTIWAAIERFSVQGIQFIVGIIVARILLPSDYGLVSMIVIFISISDAIINGGLGVALLRKKDVNDEDYKTAFTFNIIIAIFIYFILYFSAPYISKFYNQEILINIIRIMSLGFVINSFSIVHNVKLMYALRFNQQAKISIISSVSSGLLAVYLAYNGLGVWTIVFQSLLNTALTSTLLIVFIRWKPKIGFNKNSFDYMFSIGINMIFTNILNSIYNNIYGLIIGKNFNSTSLGIFNRGQSIALVIPVLSVGIFSKVSLPIFAKIQDDNERLVLALNRVLNLISFVIFPLLGLVFILSKPFVLFFLGMKWSESIFYLQIFAATAVFMPLSSINQAILLSKGRTDLTLKVELLKKAIGIVAILLFIPYGVKAIAIIGSVTNIIIYFLDINLTRQVTFYKVFNQLKTIIPFVLSTLIMIIPIYFYVNSNTFYLLQMIISPIIGIILYWLSTKYIFKVDCYTEFKDIVLNKSLG